MKNYKIQDFQSREYDSVSMKLALPPQRLVCPLRLVCIPHLRCFLMVSDDPPFNNIYPGRRGRPGVLIVDQAQISSLLKQTTFTADQIRPFGQISISFTYDREKNYPTLLGSQSSLFDN